MGKAARPPRSYLASMPVIVGVNFKPAGRIYSFDPTNLNLSPGDLVMLETARGVEPGWVKHRARDVGEDQIVAPLKSVLRLANEEDRERISANEEKAEQSLALSKERVAARGLPMKVVRAEYAFDRSQITIYFSAEGRIDFRELVKDLASALRTRIQLHQIGARDVAKLLGGIGPCGRALCCSTWMTDFAPVSMKMAKEQSLFLNPTKFSGVCGKLMCCLRFEYDTYRETKAQMPVVGGEVATPDGPGRVAGHNLAKETVLVDLRSGVQREYEAAVIERPLVRGCAVMAGGKCAGGCGEAKDSAPPRAANDIA
jgi:cell fate regulator YaaT (PSP1 superfamily)